MEVGTTNLFLYQINEDGEETLETPLLDGIILPGVTRQSILDLAREWVGAFDMNIYKHETKSNQNKPGLVFKLYAVVPTNVINFLILT